MLLDDIILEGFGQGLLYHWMGLYKAEDVLEHDAMPARWSHMIDGRNVFGNSFSRNKVFSFGEQRCIRLTIDKAALSSRHKIIPVDGEYVHQKTRYDGYSSVPPVLYDRKQHSSTGNQLAEEFAVGDIKNIHRMITEVRIRAFNSASFYNVSTMLRDYCAKWDIPLIEDQDVLDFRARTEARWAEDEDI